MPDICTAYHIDNKLGDIGGVVHNALDRFGDKHILNVMCYYHCDIMLRQ